MVLPMTGHNILTRTDLYVIVHQSAAGVMASCVHLLPEIMRKAGLSSCAVKQIKHCVHFSFPDLHRGHHPSFLSAWMQNISVSY